MARIGIIGNEGRMGHALVRAIAAAGHENAGGVDKGGDAAELADDSDALVDFSSPAALEGNLHAAIGAGIPILVGTTGLEDRHHAASEAAARLGPEWDVEVLEMHHRMKVDAPSGTALMLGQAAADARGLDLGAIS